MRKVLYREQVGNGYSEMDNNGYFHQFVIIAENSYALIETEDGLIVPIRSDRFKFIDSPEDDVWEQRRYEITKDLFVHNTFKVVPNIIIEHTDELIKVLKEKQND